MAESNRRLYNVGPVEATSAVVREHAVGIQAVNATEFLLLLHSVSHLGEKAMTRLLRLNAQGRIRPKPVWGFPPRSGSANTNSTRRPLPVSPNSTKFCWLTAGNSPEFCAPVTLPC